MVFGVLVYLVLLCFFGFLVSEFFRKWYGHRTQQIPS